ncbi:MAG: 1-deoxy-D-xylulose-5-phosphate synthase, partial [Firmicutes bacterium]|nr:1-deoxy-D-xylulose-5-phosphate synthase [Bacillota bacterium]
MTRILDRIESPGDLKKLDEKDLPLVAEEIRELLVQTVARNGGHLASNLGVVELTMALHLELDSPKDMIIWDVGHQSYVHKILTGRRKRFPSLRTLEGLSGFPRRAESAHDPFGTGHSSTSISAALGLAKARDLARGSGRVIAVIGDGAMTAGMAFEALNHAAQVGTGLIVILNDNEMSISRNVGAMASYLSRLRADPTYNRAKEEMEHLLRRIPTIGPGVLRTVERLKGSLKYLVVPGMLFEELGFTYLGPIDGHDLQELRHVLRRAKRLPGPLLVHVVTTKGKGYDPAEANPDRFHGTGPFDVATGRPIAPSGGPPTFTEAFGRALVELGARDQRVAAVTAAMRDGTGLGPFHQQFPERFFDVGIAEQHAVTFAAGLAAGGFRPVVAVYSTFLQRAFDQLLHDVCIQRLPVIFALDRAGVVGEDGETHQGAFDLTYLRCLPGMTVMVPRDGVELGRMLASAVNLGGPCAIRYPRARCPELPAAPDPRTWPGLALNPVSAAEPPVSGKGEVLRQGGHVVIAAVGPLVEEALLAARDLSSGGIEATVIDARSVKPLDEELIIAAVTETGALVTVEENVKA